jgi:hypothetical protein
MTFMQFSSIKEELQIRWQEKAEALAHDAWNAGMTTKDLEGAIQACNEAINLANIAVWVKRRCTREQEWASFERIANIAELVETIRVELLADDRISLHERKVLFATFFSLIAGYLSFMS